MTSSVLDVNAGSPLLGVQEPRILLLPEGEKHPDADAVVEFARALGVELDPWQELVLRGALRRRMGVWAAFAVAICASRQNGKNGILEVRELAGPLLLGERLLIHSAHLADTSKEAFRRLDDLIDANSWLSKDVRHIWRTNGHEAIEFTDGRRIRFRTRTKGGGRGFSGDCVIFDEAMYLSETSMGAILPVVSARPDPQIWYAGSAVDQMVHEDGVVFSRVRHRAIEGKDPRLAYFEWSYDAATPDDVTDEQAGDVDVWRRANPALGIRITPEYIADERRELGARTFAVERLGVGDWPDVTPGAGGVIDSDRWEALTDDTEQPVLESLALAFDVNPERTWASISASGVRTDGFRQAELVARERGTGWVPKRLADLVDRHGPVAVVCAEGSPAASLVRKVREAGVEVDLVAATDHAKACGEFFDLVDQGGLRHPTAGPLAVAVRGATSRPMGDAWAWSRKNSATDITALVSCTLAVWASASAVPAGTGWKGV